MGFIFAWASADSPTGYQILAGSLDAPVGVADYRTPEEEAAHAEEHGFADPAILAFASMDEWYDAVAAQPAMFAQFLDQGAVVLQPDELAAQFTPGRPAPRPVLLEAAHDPDPALIEDRDQLAERLAQTERTAAAKLEDEERKRQQLEQTLAERDAELAALRAGGV